MVINSVTEALRNFMQSYAVTFGGTFILLLIVYLLVWKLFAKSLNKWKIQQNRKADFKQIKQEIINSIGVNFTGTLISMSVLSLYSRSSVKLYTDINQYGGISTAIGSFIFLLLFADAWFYFWHRWMHNNPKIYKYIHAVHHKSLDVTPFTASSFHILEATLLGAWIIPLAFIIPIYVPMLGALQIIGLANNIKSHLGYELYPKWFQKTWLKYHINSTHHNLHHIKYNGNYGLLFTFWDIWFDTELKAPAECSPENLY
jgi:sterol desaturase/sphingolipid hydroxylase (fatty acid hydroxylase superfamily)